MLPEFNEHGLLPEGIHDCTMDEAYARFGTNDQRRRIWNGLKGCIRAMNFFGINKGSIVLAGSYVTDKVVPGDIDLILPVDMFDPHYFQLCHSFFLTYHNLLHDKYLVDYYNNYSTPSAPDFSIYFQYVGDKTAMAKNIDPKGKKGILRVASWANA